jgi:hypothetical protein
MKDTVIVLPGASQGDPSATFGLGLLPAFGQLLPR